MNRLESLRDVPDGAWTKSAGPPPREGRRARQAGRPPWLPLRSLRAAMRNPRRSWLMFRMALAYLKISLLARILPLPRAFALISPRLKACAPDEIAVGAVANALDTLLVAGLPLIHPQCWRRAAVLHRFLRFEGVDTVIVFGVSTAGTQPLEAHAWVERSGRPFAEAPQATTYRRVFEFPSVTSALS